MDAGNCYRRVWLWSLASALLVLFCPGLRAATLISKGAGWRYLDSGIDQGTDWRELWFDDDSWGFGHAELGYGDDIDGRPEVTPLNPGADPSLRFPTYYFRRFFYVADPTAFTNVLVRLLRDDGAVVYINGTEVFRSGMPDGPIDFNTLAAPPGAAGNDERRYFPGLLELSSLVSGINLIAVEVHQDALESPDLSFDLELVANVDPNAESITLLRGPYLQLLHTNTVTVRWRTLEDTTSRVRFGTSSENLTDEVLNQDLTTEHEITLTDLQPDTRYYYSIGSARTYLAGGADYYFVTAPMSGKPTRIWVIGDSGTASPQARAVFEHYQEFTADRYTDVWLMLGDNAYGIGTDIEYQRAVFDMYPELLRQTAVWSTMGNHETYSLEVNGSHAYFNNFSWPTLGQIGGEPSGTEHYYSFNYGNIHFVCLDSEESNRLPDGEMGIWLEEDLAGNTNDWLIVFWHSPPYTKGSHDSDNVFDSGGNMVQMRENILPILESHGADLVLCGHSHDYERSYLLNGHYGYSSSLELSMVLDDGSGRPDEEGAYLKPGMGPAPNQGTVYVVAGSSGWATFQVGRHPIMHTSLLRMGSLVLDIDGQRLDAKFLRETGAIDDSFSIVKGAQPETVRVTTLRFTDGQVTARWRSRPGKVYVVERATTLNPPDWTIASEEYEAVGLTSSWTDITLPGSEAFFFRIVEVR
jgi:hypothetical protein